MHLAVPNLHYFTGTRLLNKCSHDTLTFRENLIALGKWADKWRMVFKVLTVKANCYSTHSRGVVEEVKYLVVIMQSVMKFTTHINKKLMTTKQLLGMIKGENCTNTKLLAYKTLPLLSTVCINCFGSM